MSVDANALFQPFKLGDLTLPNRLVMAPLTRNRAAEGDVARDITVTYYAQRASAGLLISEGSQISHQGQGYLRTPGIYSPAQVAHWRKVTDAVHKAGGRIFIQLWHVGRVSHTSLQPGGGAPVGPSALCAQTKTFLEEGFAHPRYYHSDDPSTGPNTVAAAHIITPAPLFMERGKTRLDLGDRR